jgi:hypothetical protein
VIKSLAYFPSQCALNSQPVVAAILESAKSAGITVQENSFDADAAVIWSVLWHGRMAANQQVYQQYRSQGRPVIVADVGTLIRGTTWKLAVNNITNQGYYGHTENLDPNRLCKLGVLLQTPAVFKPSILIAAQHNRSLQLQDVVQEQWITTTVHEIRQHCDRPIIIRSHPRCRLQQHLLPPGCVIETSKKITGTYDSYNIDYSHHAVINYNSGPGIQAALAGTRPIVSSSSLASPVGVAVKDIELPYSVDRRQWSIEIAHTEYTLEEIKQGLWIHRLRAAL